MTEMGIDLSESKPQKLTDELSQQADMLVTMGCGESCPYVPGLKRQDWSLNDPKGKSLEEVRKIRDMIRERIEQLIAGQESCDTVIFGDKWHGFFGILWHTGKVW